jgi:hypothetical protein
MAVAGRKGETEELLIIHREDPGAKPGDWVLVSSEKFAEYPLPNEFSFESNCFLSEDGGLLPKLPIGLVDAVELG